MPNTIGMRELKNQTSRIIRAVREEMSEYVVTLDRQQLEWGAALVTVRAP